MKFLLVATLTVFSASSWSHNHDKHGEKDKQWEKMSFEDAKKMKTEMLAQKKALIEATQTCVDGAKDKETIKACMKSMKKEKKEMKSNMKEKMKT